MNLRNILGFSFGPIASAALGLVALPITTWVFSPQDVGRLNILQIALSFSLLVSILGLDQAYVREYHESKNKSTLLRACFVTGFFILLFLGGGSLFFSGGLAQWLYADPNPWLYFLTLFCALIGYINRFSSLILRMQERGWAYSFSQFLPKLAQLVLIFLLFFFGFKKEFISLLVITLVAQFMVTALYSWNTRSDWHEALYSKGDLSQFKGVLIFGVPLIFSGVAYWGLTAISTISLRTWSTLEEIAIYAVANSFAGAAIVFQSVFSVIWAPTIYKWVSEGVDMAIVDKVAKQALAFICFIVALCGALSWLSDWLLPSSYTQVKYLILCSLMQPLLYTLSEITCVGIGIQRRTIFSVWIAVLGLLVNLGLNYLLVPMMGAAGAAIANATAFAVFFIIRTEVSARIWRRFPRGQLYAYVLVLLGLSIGSIFAAVFGPFILHGLWFGLLLVFIFVFRMQWMAMYTIIQIKMMRRV